MAKDDTKGDLDLLLELLEAGRLLYDTLEMFDEGNRHFYSSLSVQLRTLCFDSDEPGRGISLLNWALKKYMPDKTAFITPYDWKKLEEPIFDKVALSIGGLPISRRRITHEQVEIPISELFTTNILKCEGANYNFKQTIKSICESNGGAHYDQKQHRFWTILNKGTNRSVDVVTVLIYSVGMVVLQIMQELLEIFGRLQVNMVCRIRKDAGTDRVKHVSALFELSQLSLGQAILVYFSHDGHITLEVSGVSMESLVISEEFITDWNEHHSIIVMCRYTRAFRQIVELVVDREIVGSIIVSNFGNFLLPFFNDSCLILINRFSDGRTLGSNLDIKEFHVMETPVNEFERMAFVNAFWNTIGHEPDVFESITVKNYFHNHIGGNLKLYGDCTEL